MEKKKAKKSAARKEERSRTFDVSDNPEVTIVERLSIEKRNISVYNWCSSRYRTVDI